MSRNLREVAVNHFNSFRREYRPYYPAVAVGVLSSVFLGRLAWKDYQLFLSYGPGGVPYNVFGWLLTNTLLVVGINTKDVRKFERDPDQRTWLGENWQPKPRDGGRPALGRHPIPQRQLDQHPPKEAQQRFQAAFQGLVEQNADLVDSKLSKYELHTDALWVRDDCPTFALGEDYSRETSHIHTNTDYSAHIVLAPRDAARVVSSGWGQLHGMAGVTFLGKKLIPKTYVLLYGPRNDEEIEVLIEIIKAGIGYMTDSKEVR